MNIVDAAREALRPFDRLEAAALFGSRVQGSPRPDSDLDIAVLPLGQDSEGRRHLQADVAVALAHLAPEGRVDVILLDEVPELLRQRVFETAIVLFGGDTPGWKNLRVLTMREHGDREWVRQLWRDSQHQRLTGGVTEGGSRGRSRRPLETP